MRINGKAWTIKMLTDKTLAVEILKIGYFNCYTKNGCNQLVLKEIVLQKITIRH